MLPLPHGCYTSGSGPVIHPKNWANKNASIKSYWYISYRFYDPSIAAKKLVIVKGGVNEYKTLQDRQLAIKTLLATEVEILQQGYNPIKNEILTPQIDEPTEITGDTPFIQALIFALKIKNCEPDTKIDIKSMLKYFEKSAIQLGRSRLPIKDVKRKDIRLILDNCQNVPAVDQKGKPRKKVWNNNQFNHYRKYLSALYFELEELEIVEYNPVEKIAKRETIGKIRDVLTDKERQRINDHLSKVQPALLRFVNIFFHSGSRRSELFKLKASEVDISGQRFKTIVKKGNQKREVWKTIKDIALPFWIDAMETCGADDYVFSRGLLPGRSPVRPEYVTKLWLKHVKASLGISCDFYSLKHLHTTEILDYLGEEKQIDAAADHNSHTSTAMVVNIYDVKQQQRKHNRVKGIKNSFA